jgi:hypothetical protein
MVMSLRKDDIGNMPLLNTARALRNKQRIIKTLFVFMAVFVFYNIPKKYLGDTYPICLYRLVSKQKCWGCGTTRAIWSILHLRIKDAMEYNNFVVITFPLLAGCTVSWIIGSRPLLYKNPKT